MSDWTPPSDVQVRVVCAACKLGDGTLIVGPRHWDSVMHATRKAITGAIRSHQPSDQGFIDQWGRFMTRTEAWKVAEAAGQILHLAGGMNGPELYSENLY